MKSNLDIIKRNKLPVVIYGAGSIGKLLKDKIEKLGIRVRYFCDDTDEKWGNKFCDIDVVGINFLKDTGKDYLFIISLRFMNSLIAELEKLGFNNHFAGGVLITNDDIAKETEGIEKERLGLCKVYHDSASMYGKSSIHNVDIMITEK